METMAHTQTTEVIQQKVFWATVPRTYPRDGVNAIEGELRVKADLADFRSFELGRLLTTDHDGSPKPVSIVPPTHPLTISKLCRRMEHA